MGLKPLSLPGTLQQADGICCANAPQMTQTSYAVLWKTLIFIDQSPLRKNNFGEQKLKLFEQKVNFSLFEIVKLR